MGTDRFPIDYLSSVFTPHNIMVWLVFNQPKWCIPLWYLHAILYVYLIYYGLLRLNEKSIKRFTLFAPLLLLPYICISLLFYTSNINPPEVWLICNAYFNGLPFFAIGCIIKMYLEPFKAFVGKMKSENFYLLLVILAAIQIFERFQHLTEVYISTILLTVLLFIFSAARKDSAGKTALSAMGKKHSGMIYLIHYLILEMTWQIPGYAQFSEMPVYKWSASFLILFASLIFSIVFSRVKGFFSKKS